MKNKLVIVLLFIANLNFAQLRTSTFEEVEKFSAENPKPILIFIHTDWCKICKMMENSTFKNSEVINELNKNFYFISFNAEEKKQIDFLGKSFKFKPKGKNSGIHELAEELSNQIYPTITILDKNFSIVSQIESFLDAKILLNILKKIR